nr:unnamed protein product [Digitaria exilis]
MRNQPPGVPAPGAASRDGEAPASGGDQGSNAAEGAGAAVRGEGFGFSKSGDGEVGSCQLSAAPWVGEEEEGAKCMQRAREGIGAWVREVMRCCGGGGGDAAVVVRFLYGKWRFGREI